MKHHSTNLQNHNQFRFLKSAFWLGLTAFGGPQLHLPYFKRELVDKHKFLSHQELIEINAFCNALPGPSTTQTISTIAAAESSGGLGGSGSPELSVNTAPATPANLAVVSMANTMQQFDANGQLVALSAPLAPPLNGLNLAGTQGSLSNGVLAAPGTIKPS